MPEIINIEHDEVRATYKGTAPEGFRFAKVDDFHTGGVRKDHVPIYLLMAATKELVEFGFNHQTKRDWLQWQLNREVVFIKTGDRPGVQKSIYPILMPSDDYLKQVLKVSGGV